MFRIIILSLFISISTSAQAERRVISAMPRHVVEALNKRASLGAVGLFVPSLEFAKSGSTLQSVAEARKAGLTAKMVALFPEQDRVNEILQDPGVYSLTDILHREVLQVSFKPVPEKVDLLQPLQRNAVLVFVHELAAQLMPKNPTLSLGADFVVRPDPGVDLAQVWISGLKDPKRIPVNQLFGDSGIGGYFRPTPAGQSRGVRSRH